MRIIIAPAEKASFKALGRQQEVSFQEFLTAAIEQYQPCGKGIKNIRQADRVLRTIEAMAGSLALSVEDYNLVNAAVNAAEWAPAAAVSFLPFFDAIEGAKDAQPEAAAR